MKRRFFMILSALSLLLGVAVCAMWVRSYWTRDQYNPSDGTSVRGYVSRRGWFGYNELTLGTRGWLGMEWSDNSGTMMGVTYQDHGRRIAYCTLAIPLAFLPMIWLVRSARLQSRDLEQRRILRLHAPREP